MSVDRVAAVAVLEFLTRLKNERSNADNLETAIAILEEEFGVALNPESFQVSYYPHTLPELLTAGAESLHVKPFGEVKHEVECNESFPVFQKAVEGTDFFAGCEPGSLAYEQKYAEFIRKVARRISNVSGPSRVELEKQAEDFKLKGNQAINSKDFQTAVEHYSEAIRLSSDGPNSHVYYSNRAAAYCHLNKYEEAVADCQSSLALSPDYVKAYSRLGLANFFLEKYQEAVDAYERAAELEPDNKATQDSLRQARNKLKKTKGGASAPATDVAGAANAAGGGNNMAGLANLMGNPMMKKALDQVGGPAGVANLMKDPQMMAMAQQMMKDPQMMQQAMAMLGGGAGGAGGGMPDLGALAAMMGGGAGGAGMEPPSSSSSSAPSSSSKSGKKPFKGFEG